METILGLIMLLLLLVSGCCLFFLLFVQPIWGVVDVAVSKEHSGGTKAVVIVLTLILLGPIMTFCYACFGTRSSVLRRTTLISFALFLVTGLSVLGLAVAAPATKQFWGRVGKGGALVNGNPADAVASSTFTSQPADEVTAFTALHLVSKGASSWSECITEFTGSGPKSEATIPLVLPGIYPICHLAIDPNGPAYYAITTHEVGRIVPATGRFIEFETDPAIGKPSWPAGVAYDSNRGLVLLTARSQGYSHNPVTDEWKLLPGLKDDNLVGLVYTPEADVLYSLRAKPGGGLATHLVKFNPNGALLAETELSSPIPMGQYPFPLAQLCRSGDQLVVLVSSQDRAGAKSASPVKPAMYSIDPATGRCRLVEPVTTTQSASASRSH